MYTIFILDGSEVVTSLQFDGTEQQTKNRC